MPIAVALHAQPHPFLEIVSSGVLGQAELEDAVRAAGALAAEHGVWDVLNDAAAVTQVPSVGGLYWLGELVQQTAGPDIRVALVHAPTGQPREAGAFWETTALNRLIRVRAFDERDDALAWLVGLAV